MDERERARRALWAHRPSAEAAGGAKVCFVLKVRRGTGPASNFNVRAWLHYEAGRHADLDLSSLPGGAWPSFRSHAEAVVGTRAAVHAQGDRARASTRR